MNKKSIFILLIIYLLSSFGAYTAFGYFSKNAEQKPGTQIAQNTDTTASNTNTPSEEEELEEEDVLIEIEPGAARSQECPINGKMYTQAEKDSWSARRPLAVMIENHPEARPQSGLSEADVVFEALAEGGVTRFMGVFYCEVQRKDTVLAPIRSARTYFIDWASGYNLPMYVHVGGANVPGPTDALGQIRDYGWAGENDMNQFSIGFPTFVRDYNRIEGKELDTEHTMITSTEKLWDVALKRDWTNITPSIKGKTRVKAGVDWQEGFTPWAFQDDKPGQGSTSPISFEFWDGYKQYSVTWQYDPATNSYKRDMAGEPHLDLNSNKQIMAKNAVILFTDEKGPINDQHHMLYRTTGTGDALVFQNGSVVKAKWSKKDRESQLLFQTADGQDLELVRGLTWISVLDVGTKVSY